MPAAGRVSAVVLGAGSSQRFGGGRHKLLSEWRGRTLIEHVIEAAIGARTAGVVSEVLVVTTADAARLKSLAGADGCRVVHPAADRGIGASLQAAIAAADPASEGVVVLLGDQPKVTLDAVAAVVAAAKGSPQALVRARYKGYADPVSHPVYIGRYHFALVHQIGADGGFHATTEKRGLRWKEVWLEGDNPDVDHPFDLNRLG